ncbi:hypothetical protein FB451DRAFT_1391628 [Mycena latifolia]|nr:hypothetical protein FB451DRAFT_1391628 [Mycena latifolia]
MFSKFALISSAALFLVLAQGAIAVPGHGPVVFPCGSPDDAPCPSGWICCVQDNGNFCHELQDGFVCILPTLPGA